MVTKRVLGWLSLLTACGAAAFGALAFLTALGAGVDDFPANNDQIDRWLTLSTLGFLAALALLVAGVIALGGRRGRPQPSDDASAPVANASAPLAPAKPDDSHLTLLGYIAGVLIGAVLLVTIDRLLRRREQPQSG